MFQIYKKISLLIKKSRNPFRLAIWGWWQGHNLGDNWIRQIWSDIFPDAIFIDTSVMDFGDFDFVIGGGGGVFIRDVIPPWNGAVDVAFGFAGLGAEFQHPTQTASNLAKKAGFFFVRDEHSIKCMHLSEKNRSYDLTFYAPLELAAHTDMERCLFVWRDPGELLSTPDFRQYIGSPSAQKQWFESLSACFRKIDNQTFATNKCQIEKMTSKCGFIVSARYHGIVAAIQRGIPCIGIDVCPKIRALMTESGLSDYCIQYSDVDRLPGLIAQARSEYAQIQNLQRDYRKMANETLSVHIAEIRECVKETSATLKK